MYYSGLGLTFQVPRERVVATPVTTATTGRKGGGSLPLPQHRYIQRKGKKKDAEYLIYKVPPWTEQSARNTLLLMEKQLGLPASSDKWFRRSNSKSDVPSGTVVFQRYVPKRDFATNKISEADLKAFPPEHKYVYREGKKADADMLYFRSPPWNTGNIKKTSWLEWERRFGLPPGGQWFQRTKSDVPQGHIVFQRYTTRRISPEDANISTDVVTENQTGLITGPQPGQMNKIIIYLGVAGAAVALGLLLTRKK